MSLWTSQEVLEATNGELLGSEWQVSGLCMDTRVLKQGELFLAFEGEQSDGHDYVASALSKGASAAIVSKLPDGIKDNAPLLEVVDTQTALEALAVSARNRSSAKRIGVTGSVGKTSTKEMLACALGELGKTHAAQGSYNNFRGVPFTLASMPQDTQFGVFEIGMNHLDEITPLSEMVQPDISIITTVEKVHLENFDSEEGIAQAKSEIFDGMSEGGYAILNADNKWFEYLSTKAKNKGLNIISFGTVPDVQSALLSYSDNKVVAMIMGEEIEFEFHIPGQHMAINALSVLTAVKCVGGDITKAAIALKDMKPVAGRGERHELMMGVPELPLVLIDESYNASPVATKAALETLKNTPCGGRRIFVMGDMYELGDQEQDIHLELKEDILNAGVEKFFACGSLVNKLYEDLPEDIKGASHEDSLEIAQIVTEAVKAGDVVLVKGSRGGGKRPRMYETVAAILEKGKK